MIRHGRTVAALATVGALLLVGCRSDDSDTKSTTAPTTTVAGGTETTAAPVETTGESTAETTAETTGETTAETTEETTADTEAADTTTAETEPAAEAWTANIDDCSDDVTAPIEGDIRIGSVLPLTGPVATGFAPVNQGLVEYIKYANDNGLVEGHNLVLDVRDDAYDPNLTPSAVSALIDDGAAFVTGIIGSDNNLAVRDTLNEECIPQLLALSGSPDWGDIEEYPWTTGALVPYSIETQIYAKTMVELGVKTVAIYRINNEFGKVFSDGFREAAEAAGLEIVDDQTIELGDGNPPSGQLDSIAGNAPDAIMAVPLSTQCPAFTTELVKAKARAGGTWEPLVFQTNTCASRLLISLLAAGSGDGVYTSSNLVDPVDPKNADNPGVVALKAAYDAAGYTTDIATVSVGWSVGEYTVNIINKALESGSLTRQSIIEAARNLEFVPSLGREGTVYKLNGEEDFFSFESLTVLQWDEANNAYIELGPEDTSFES